MRISRLVLSGAAVGTIVGPASADNKSDSHFQYGLAASRSVSQRGRLGNDRRVAVVRAVVVVAPQARRFGSRCDDDDRGRPAHKRLAAVLPGSAEIVETVRKRSGIAMLARSRGFPDRFRRERYGYGKNVKKVRKTRPGARRAFS
jgi:hypothetical protein